MPKKRLLTPDSAARAAERELAASVVREYEKRREERRSVEAQWTLNACFLAGRQFAEIGPMLEVSDAPPTRRGRNGRRTTTSRP